MALCFITSQILNGGEPKKATPRKLILGVVLIMTKEDRSRSLPQVSYRPLHGISATLSTYLRHDLMVENIELIIQHLFELNSRKDSIVGNIG